MSARFERVDGPHGWVHTVTNMAVWHNLGVTFDTFEYMTDTREEREGGREEGEIRRLRSERAALDGVQHEPVDDRVGTTTHPVIRLSTGWEMR